MNKNLFLLMNVVLLTSCTFRVNSSYSNNDSTPSLENSYLPSEEPSLNSLQSNSVEEPNSVSLPSLSYSSSEESKQSSQEIIETELLKDTDFDNLNNWIVFPEDNENVFSVLQHGDKKISFKVNNFTAEENWSIQFLQNGISLDSQNKYHVHFEIVSTINRTIQFIIQSMDYQYFAVKEAINLTNGQVFSFDQIISTGYDNTYLYGFMLGKMEGQDNLVNDHTIEISNVSLKRIDSQNENIPPYIENRQLVFSDEFNGNSIDANNWFLETGDGAQYGIPGWGNNEAEYYSPNNATIRNGKLVITAKKERMGTFNFTSARLKSQNLQFFKYGYFEANIKMPAISGMWPAFWMLPNDSPYGGWPMSGEIDIMEARGREPNKTDHTIHYGVPHNYNCTSYTMPNGNRIDEFHRYGLEWTSEYIRWYVDDIMVHTEYNSSYFSSSALDKPSAPFDQDFYILFNLAVGGNYDGGTMPPASFTSAEMEVDYVRVYQ